MSREFNRDVVETPEFELRCNAFVAEVDSTVAPKYPTLHIIATNETLKDITGLKETIQHWQALPAEYSERFIRASRRIANKSDRASAFFNQATVDIADTKAPKSKERKKLIQRAVKEVRKIASEYGADDDAYEAIDLKGPYPIAHLGYFFSENS